MNLLGTQVHPPCLEPETWLMKNQKRCYSRFYDPHEFIEKKTPMWKKFKKTNMDNITKCHVKTIFLFSATTTSFFYSNVLAYFIHKLSNSLTTKPF
jgi:hypothetical protein